MQRRSFLKIASLGLAPFVNWFETPTPQTDTGETLHFQQDPPVDHHYADQETGILGVSGATVTVDLSAFAPHMKVVHGFLYLMDNSGRGTWKIETRPAGLNPPPNLGFQWLESHHVSGVEIGLQCAIRCDNNSRFELRVTRQDATNIEWSFAPVWWFS